MTKYIHKYCGGMIKPFYARDENGKKCMTSLVCNRCFQEFPCDGETS